MKMIIVAAVLFLFSFEVFAQSFVYDGFECEGSQSPSTNPKQSRFEVVEKLGNGTYRILFTGGLPLFSTSSGPCVGNSFGVETKEGSNGEHVERKDAQAIAYFTGTHLIITMSLANAYGKGEVFGDVMVTSMVMPQTYTWIFDFVPETTSFKMIRGIDIRGTVMAVGSAIPSPGRVVETIISNAPTTATPPSAIKFHIE